MEEKNRQQAALQKQVSDSEKEIKKVSRAVQASREKQERKSSQGKSSRSRKDQPKIMQNFFQNRASATAGGLALKGGQMIEEAQHKLAEVKQKIENVEVLDLDLISTKVPVSKKIAEFKNVNFSYPNGNKVIDSFSLTIYGPKRMAIHGSNGSGKSTLIKLLMGELQPTKGSVERGSVRLQYLDQTVKFLDQDLTVLENFMAINPQRTLQESHSILAEFLFRNVASLKKVSQLSGGERIRAGLACVLGSKEPPHCLILDEPNNHLDIDSLQNIESALRQYLGALIVVSHDDTFLENIDISEYVTL